MPRSKLLWALLGMLGLYLSLALLAWIKPVPVAKDHPHFADIGFQVIAHRGGWKLGPESTILQFHRVAELGVDVLEMDVHARRDGELVVIHDPTVNRTTDGNGRVNSLTLRELRDLDAGYSWSDDDGITTPYRGQGIRIPTMAEMLEAFPGQRMLVEIKSRTSGAPTALCDHLRQHDALTQVAVAAFGGGPMQEFRAACPEVATSPGVGEMAWYLVMHKLRLDALTNPGFQVFHVPKALGAFTIVDEGFVRRARERNMPVQVWTINRREEMARLMDLGVTGIMTARPDLLLKLKREREL
ncbi:MAG: glycerophosphodiester phosphodiesterase [Candidatus Latescibacterota bacterium]|nr:glycerophosphodiester phosphodiesterase [Candidatus Latescibacterota bacterium]